MKQNVVNDVNAKHREREGEKVNLVRAFEYSLILIWRSLKV